MQLASDAAAKPPSPDRVFEAASVVPSSFCSASQNPEFPVTSRNGAVSAPIGAHRRNTPVGRSFFRSGSTGLMSKLWVEVPQPVAQSGDERLNVRNSLVAACRCLE